jgi:hypothetical protein
MTTTEENSGPAQIRMELKDIRQLFHSMDPSPFREKDLDLDAEEFIVSWARELPKNHRIHLKIQLTGHAGDPSDLAEIAEAVRNYFNYRAERMLLRQRELLREGWFSLAVGLTFLATCLVLARYLSQFGGSTFYAIVRESLIIGGWVAMWRPMQIFLYDRWPLRRMRRLYQRLGEMEVRVEVKQV